MTKLSTKNIDRKAALAEFSDWIDLRLAKQVQNMNTLRPLLKEAMRNPVLEFVIPLALNQIVEHSCLRVVEAWELLNDELTHQKRRTIGTKNRDFINLKRLRNKLIAHRVPNDLNGKVHRNWYLKKYGSFEAVMTLIQRIGTKISEKIRSMQNRGQLPTELKLRRPVTVLDEQYVRQMISLLKDNGMA